MKNRNIFLAIFLSLFVCKISAQEFTQTDTIELLELRYTSSAFGDYDNDGDLDLLMAGSSNYGDTTLLYRNNGDSSFTIQRWIQFDNVTSACIDWGDYNNDGLLDVLLTGRAYTGSISKIYKNNGNNTFSPQININLDILQNGSANWVDIDNDGDLDIFISGRNSEYDPKSKLYMNIGNNSFTEVNIDNIPGVEDSFSAWADYNNDGYQDLLLCGDDIDGEQLTKIYKNNGDNTFTEQSLIFLKGNSRGSAQWGDYNNDGFMDIVIIGYSGFDYATRIYKNNGDNTFSEQFDITLPSIYSASVKWGDYNNDGNLDLVIIGRSGNNILKIYKNNYPSSGFTEQTNIDLIGVYIGNANWADIDNSGDLDLFISGNDDSYNETSILYLNKTLIQNTPPNSPSNLQSFVTDNSVKLKWDKTTDSGTTQDGLSYNIYIGNSSLGNEKVSSMSDNSNGYRKVVSHGNVGKNDSIIINSLMPGTYYWSVQAIDHTYEGSTFASEESFIINTCNDLEILLQPVSKTAYEKESIQFEIDVDGLEPIYYNWFKNNIQLYNDDNISGANSRCLSFNELEILDAGAYHCVVSDTCGMVNSDTIDLTVLPLRFFEDTTNYFEGVYNGDIEWGDYDNDNYLDVIITGNSSTILYRNNGDNKFALQDSFSFIQADNASVDWGDYDNDGDLDILVTGNSYAGRISKIYKNDLPDSVYFTEQTQIPLSGVYNGDGIWGDYDNDGDLDILICGYNNSNQLITEIYKNDGDTTFTLQSNFSVTGVYYASADWGDYDNDGDLDILISGNSSAGRIFKVFKNTMPIEPGFAEQTSIILKGIYYGESKWGDYDNDGDLDILSSGYDSESNRSTILYKNFGNNVFEEQSTILLEGVQFSSIDWGDYNNNGYLDILLSGYNENNEVISRVYKNNGDNTFTEANDTKLIGVQYGSSSWGDIDNDGDLDILLTGKNEEWTSISKLYINRTETPNTPPTSPSNLQSTVIHNSVVLSWNKATDYETGQNGLTYNIYVGTTSGGNEALSSMSDNTNGKRKIVLRGNAGFNNTYTINNLPPANYNWSVQAIDKNYEGSSFSGEVNFEISECNIADITLQPESNTYYEEESIELSCMASGIEPLTYQWYKDEVIINNTLEIEGAKTANLIINSLTIADAGSYKCVVTNQCGDAETNIAEIIVLIKPFSEQTDFILNAVDESDSKWGDYDDDGDLDIILTGKYNSKIYKNDLPDSAYFSLQTSINLTQVTNGHVDWGDYDNDGDIDILLTGNSYEGYISKVYKNTLPDSISFEEQEEIVLTGINNCTVNWEDYDNDGDLDIIMAGSSYDGEISKIYKNNGDNTFVEQLDIELEWNKNSSWGDFDSDGLKDVIVNGIIYKNSGDNNFISQNDIVLDGIEDYTTWVDYDNDGDLDIASSFMYRNNGDNTFTKITSVPFGNKTHWGDMDNDGDLDVLEEAESSESETKIYKNEGNNTFTELSAVSLAGFTNGSVVWGDYNNDGDLDILLCGSWLTTVYQNTFAIANTTPVAPTNLQSFVQGNDVLLNWNKAFDNETSQSGLSYNYYIGLSSENQDVSSSMANITNGKRKIVSSGNAGFINIKKVLNLAPGNYYWSVQTIDNNYEASDFATEQEFTISTWRAPEVSLNPESQIVFEGDSVELVCIANGIEPLTYQWFKNGTALTNSADFEGAKSNKLKIRNLTLSSDIAYYCYIISPCDNTLSDTAYINTVKAPFVKADVILEGISNGSADWIDINMDGWMDIFLAKDGYYKIFFNNGNNTFSTTPITAFYESYNSKTSFGDYDNDGDLDILLTGVNWEYNAKVYKNNGDSTFTNQTEIILTAVNSGSGAWGDCDNDGDLDILISGYTNEGEGYISKIYKNNGDNTFTEQANIVLKGLRYSTCNWGDLDNDGDLDIIISGQGIESGGAYGYQTITKIYQNNAPSNYGFTEIENLTLKDVYQAVTELGDFDNDGYLDILLCGNSDAGRISLIYRNNGNMSFIELNEIKIIGISQGSAKWGDLNNDGNLDFLISGQNNDYEKVSYIYINDGNGSFIEQFPNPLPGVYLSSTSLADYNLDGDLDILLAGSSSDFGIISYVYENTSDEINNDPEIPTNLDSAIQQNTVTLSWDKASDLETNQESLTYNIYIGSSSENADILSPMANINNGKPFLNQFGNAGLNNFITIKNLAAGTYYWSVQTIDNAFNRSLFANEQSFIITECNTPQISIISDTVFTFENQSAELFCIADGIEPFTYQWHRNGEILIENDTISKVNTQALNLKNISPYFEGEYYCEVTNVCGSTNSDSITFKVSKSTFEEQIGFNIVGVRNGSSEWGDYNNDGFLDILLTGYSDFGYTSIIYKNNDGNGFSQLSTIQLAGITYGDAKWGDYNNDDYLDIILCGYSYIDGVSGTITKIYRNNKDNTFSELIDLDLTGVEEGSVNWFDFDNDGDMDIILSGEGEDIDQTLKIYVNSGNDSFIERYNTEIGGIRSSSIDCGDYNNDGFIDFFVCGYDENYNTVSKLYKNSGPNDFEFIEQTNISFNGAAYGSAKWGDYNNDGFLDIAYCGYSKTSDADITVIYKNNGDNTFSEQANIVLTPLENGSLDWGDYDKDGYLDLAITGRSNSNLETTIIYHNNNGYSFSEQASINLIQLESSSIAWGDYDNDGDLDVIINGQDIDNNRISKIYKNNLEPEIPIIPSPDNLQSTVLNNSVTLNWDKPTDQNTAPNSLTFNVYVGSKSDTTDKVNPMSDITTGKLKIIYYGNAEHNNSYFLKNLLPGTYYWSVQSIDRSYGASPFTEEQYFTISECTSPSVNIQPIAATVVENSVLELVCLGNGPEPITYKWYNDGVALTNNSTIIGSSEPRLVLNPAQISMSGEYHCILTNVCGNTSSNTVGINIINAPLTEQSIVFNSTGIDTKCFGDYDNDGDMDIFLNGKIYKNKGDENFEEPVEIISTEFTEGCSQWGDFDNDGDLDILISFYSQGNYYNNYDDVSTSKLFENEGNDIFTDLNLTEIENLGNGSISWGDYDNDGDLDFLIIGANENQISTSKIFENTENNTFEDTNLDIPQIKEGNALWNDYDNDGDLDILFTGSDYSGNAFAEVYKNNGNGNFSSIDAELEKVNNVFAEWADYNNDGFSDIIIIGSNLSDEEVSIIYKNNGGNSFTNISANIEGYYIGHSSWGDYDLDGDLDLLLTGERERYDDEYSALVNNQGNDVFTDINFSLVSGNEASSGWADYNNDNKIDLFISEDNITRIYKNNASFGNTLPNIPENLQVNIIENKAVFSWDSASDTETPSEGLSYNMRLGNTPYGIELISPHSHILSGKRSIVDIGNTGFDTNHIILDLPPGTYYWSVQTIDNNYEGSAFAFEETFTISPEFTDIGLNFDSRTNSIWGDYDNDGDMDILQYGISSYNVKIYRNDNGIFTDIEAVLSNITYGSADWGDYDKDGDLDIILSGRGSSYVGITKLFRNDQNDIFREVNTNFIGVQYSSCKWGDYDMDGDLDLFIAGQTSDAKQSKIYRNDGNDIFTDINADIIGVYYCSSDWGDCDNDGDLDIVINGKSNAGAVTKIYVNLGNDTFSEVLVDLIGTDGSVQWGDYDNDNDLDLLISGYTNESIRITKIYKNQGSNNFIELITNLQGIREGEASWGDYDNDGDLDILIAGESSTNITSIYRNDNQDIFTEIEYDFEGTDFCSAKWGDYDKDNDLDILVSGNDFSKIYQNNSFWTNVAPYAPTNLNSSFYNYGIYLNWDKALDEQSTNDGLYYNLRMGSTPGGSDFINPMSNLNTGYLLKPNMGNLQSKNFWFADSLAVGTYYWSVQAIDHAFVGGPWSEEKTFTITVIRADFESMTACLGDTTFFNDVTLTGETELTAWKWNFGDGNTSSVQNPYHIYDESGKYNVKLISIGGEYSDTIVKSVTVKPKPIVNFTANDECSGSLTNFLNTTNTDSVTVTSWAWDFGDGSNIEVENPSAHSYGVGTYTVQLIAVADNACSDTIFKDVSVGAYPNANISLNGNTSFCEGDSTILFVNYNSEYSYSWKLNNVNVSGANMDSLIVYNNTGNYSVEIINPLGNCISTSAAVPITVNPTPNAPFINYTGNTSFCAGESLNLSVIDNPDYTYQWKLLGAGAIGGDVNQWNATISGEYSLDVTNSYSCSSRSSNSVLVEVFEKPILPTIGLSGPKEFCDGNSVILSVNKNPANTYQWLKNGFNIFEETDTIIEITNSGSYSLLIGNINGCFSQTSPEVVNVLDSPPIFTISTSGDLSFCQGGSVVLSVTDNTDYIYKWKKDGGAIGTDLNEYTANASGAYSLQATNTYGCSSLSVADIVVEVFSNPTVPTINLSGAKVFCSGSSIVLSVLDNADYSYQWKENGNNISGENTNSIEVNNSGSYSLLVSNSNNCNVQTSSEEVTVLPSPASPSITYSGDLEFCEGGSVSLSVTDNPDYTYEWKLGSGAIGSDSNTLTATNQGTYSLVISDPNNCEALSSNTIDVSYLPVPNQPIIQASGSLVFCEGDSVLLYFTQEAGTSIVWKNGVSPISTTSDSFYAKVGGVYSVEVENASGCSSASSNTKTVIVNDIPNPVSIGWTGTLEFCDDQSTTLSVTEQTGCSYKWYKDAEVLIGENTSSLVTSQSGDYYVRIENVSLCEYITDPVSVNVYARPVAPTITADGTTTICPSESVELSVESTSYNYQWKLDGVNISDANTNTFLAFDEGKYTLEIFNSICSNTTGAIDIVHKPAFEKPVLSAQGPNVWVLSCDNDQAQVYRWYYDGNLIPEADNYVYVANKNLGDYYVTVNDGGDCFTPSDIITIPVDLTGLEEEIAIFGDINIYPNPTPGVFTIEMDNQIIGILHLRIVNMAGKELFNIKHSKTTKFFSTQMDLSGQGKGVYFIEFRFEKDHTVRKVMVE